MCQIDIVRVESFATRFTSENPILMNVSILVGLHIGLLGKVFSANVTRERLHPGVCPSVVLHGASIVGHVVAVGTVEFVVARVLFRFLRVDVCSSGMEKQLAQCLIELFTLATCVDFDEMLLAHVLRECVRVLIRLGTRGASVGDAAIVHRLVAGHVAVVPGLVGWGEICLAVFVADDVIAFTLELDNCVTHQSRIGDLYDFIVV